MSATADRALEPAVVRRPSTISRVYGLGSVFGKTLRDSRWAIAVFTGFTAFLLVATIGAFVAEFDTLQERLALAAQMESLPPIFSGILGPPEGLETLPGFLSWRALGFMPVTFGIWSIVALSGTIAGEAGRGSLELLVSTPMRRAAIAVQKVVAHVVAMAIVLLLAALATWALTGALGTQPGDAASLGASLAMFGWVLVMAIAAGGAAFAAGSFLTRTAAGGVGALFLIGSFLVNGYADLIPGFDVLQRLSMFDWTQGFRPLVDRWDWAPVLIVAVLAVVLLAIGVIGFARRDLGATVRFREGGRPILPLGLRGPTGRSAAERLPTALAGGAGLGLFGLLIAASATAFLETLSQTPQILDLIERLAPGVDLTTAGGLLELYFVNFGTLLLSLLAAAIIAGWASDERERRLDMVLATPLARIRWGIASGLGTMIAVAIVASLMAVGVAIGSLAVGDDAVTPAIGSLVLGLYMAAFVGIGLAVGGLGWPGIAALVVAAVAIGLFLLELIGGILRLPDAIMQLSLVRHLGHPMTGTFDVPGLVLFAGLAIGGLLLGAWGIGRRDVGR
jgi:ABC-2 type transport system permease protein